MGKIKTIKSVAKRFKLTKFGKFKYKHSNLRHLLTKKKANRKRFLRKKSILHIENKRTIKYCVPYIKK